MNIDGGNTQDSKIVNFHEIPVRNHKLSHIKHYLFTKIDNINNDRLCDISEILDSSKLAVISIDKILFYTMNEKNKTHSGCTINLQIVATNQQNKVSTKDIYYIKEEQHGKLILQKQHNECDLVYDMTNIKTLKCKTNDLQTSNKEFRMLMTVTSYLN